MIKVKDNNNNNNVGVSNIIRRTSSLAHSLKAVTNNYNTMNNINKNNNINNININNNTT